MLLVGSVPTDSEVVCLGFSPLSLSLVVSCGGPSASGRLGPLVCFLSFEIDLGSRSWVHYWFFWYFGLPLVQLGW